MSDRPHVVNRIYSFLLIACAVLGFLLRYLSEGDLQYTALIPAGFGIILLPMSGGIKKENKVIAHVAVVLTLLIAVLIGKMWISAITADLLVWRKVILFGIITLSSVWALVNYVQGFIAKKKNKSA